MAQLATLQCLLDTVFARWERLPGYEAFGSGARDGLIDGIASEYLMIGLLLFMFRVSVMPAGSHPPNVGGVSPCRGAPARVASSRVRDVLRTR